MDRPAQPGAGRSLSQGQGAVLPGAGARVLGQVCWGLLSLIHTELTQIYTDIHIDECKHMLSLSLSLTHTHTHTCSSLSVAGSWLVPFVWSQKGLVTGLNGPPAPAEHDSFRRLVPQACLVPVLATSAGQVVRRFLGPDGTRPGAPTDPLPAGPGRLPPAAASP